MKTTPIFTCIILILAAPISHASRHTAAPVRVDVRTSFGGRLATGVEMVGTPSGETSEAFDTTALPDGWNNLSREGESTSICIRNDIGVLGGRLPAGAATEFAVSTNLIRHNVVVPTGSTAIFHYGCVLKFTENAGLVAEFGAMLDLRGVALADALDDSAGGDSDFGWVGASGGSHNNWISAQGHSFSTLAFISHDRLFCPNLSWTVGGIDSTYGNLPIPPDETHFFFEGWYTEPSGGKLVTATSPIVSGNRTLYAKWTAKTYSVSLNRQSGTGGTASVTATYGAAMPTITLPTRTGYTFGGYYTAANGGGTQYYTASGTSARNCDFEASTTLYAKWTANTYAVTLDRQNGTGGSAAVTATYGSAMPSITVPRRTGYTFGGYYTAANGAGTQYYDEWGAPLRNCDMTSSTTLYAKWTGRRSVITLCVGDDIVYPADSLVIIRYPPELVDVTYGSPMPAITPHSPAGYTFGGYYSESGGAGVQYYNADGTSARNFDMLGMHGDSLYAKLTPNTYMVTLNPYGGTGGTTSVIATYGADMPSITPPTRTGYTFDGYYYDGDIRTRFYTASGASARTWALPFNATIFAKWTGNTYVVTLDSQGGSGGSASVSAIYGGRPTPDEAMPQISPPARSGYTFEGYFSAPDGGGTQYYDERGWATYYWDVPSSSTIYAKWTANTYAVTLDPQGGSGGTASVTATYGSAMPAITRPRRNGYTFGGYWTGPDGSGTQYYTASGASARDWDKTETTTLYALWTESLMVLTLDGSKLTITGEGELSDSFVSDPAILACADEITWIEVGEGVTEIGSYAFSMFPNVTTIALPDTLDAIAPDAFDGCDNLEMLFIPSDFFDVIDQLGIPDTCSVISTDIYNFVKRLYNLCLGREPDQGGLNNWCRRLATGERDGANAAYGFLMSAEMKNRNLSNADFVEVLYNAMMGRASDVGGKANWVARLDGGVSRAGAINGFAMSAEFTAICQRYGIVRGTVNPAYLEKRDVNFGVTMFAARLYTKALGRGYDIGGLNNWCNRINTSRTPKAAAINAAVGFFHSAEFKNRRLSNAAYVDVLYNTFLGRNPDATGRANWIRKLNGGMSRDAAMAGFYNSAEFNSIMAGYGIR